MKINKKNYITIYSIILFIFLLLLLVLNVIRYNVFPQAYVLYESKANFITLIINFHPHFPRYLLISPSLLVNKLTGINIHTVNSIYSIFLISLTCFFILKTVIFYRKKIYIMNFILTFLFILIICLNINGRIIFSYFGESLLIYSLLYKRNKQLFLYLIIGFLYTTASSGTMIVSVIGLIFSLIHLKKIKSKILILFSPLGILIFKYLIIMLRRNYEYFNNSIFKILKHGIFSKFYGEFYFKYIILLYILILFIYVFIIVRKKGILTFFEISSFGGGLFGKTTFFMCLIPLIIHLNIILLKRKNKNENIKNNINCNVLDNRI